MQTQQQTDAELKVAGQIPYVLNLDLPGLAHAACVRSPLAHARIVSIDTSKAEALPGVVCVLTRDDLITPSPSTSSGQAPTLPHQGGGSSAGALNPYYG